jgi:hypothetical protein
MKDRKNPAALQTSRGLARHPHLRELSMTYEGHNESVSIHPPDISAKGMFINTATRFPEGSVLKLRFRLARTGVEIATRCEVRYCLPGVGVGVEFLDLPPECASVIEKEIRHATR